MTASEPSAPATPPEMTDEEKTRESYRRQLWEEGAMPPDATWSSGNEDLTPERPKPTSHTSLPPNCS